MFLAKNVPSEECTGKELSAQLKKITSQIVLQQRMFLATNSPAKNVPTEEFNDKEYFDEELS
jgi:hypothetical protein